MRYFIQKTQIMGSLPLSEVCPSTPLAVQPKKICMTAMMKSWMRLEATEKLDKNSLL